MAERENDKISNALSVLYEETADLLHIPKEVSQIDREATLKEDWYFTFHKDYVSKNKPLIIKNYCTDFPACKKWNIEYFRKSIGSKNVTVAVTPNGYADGIALSPHVEDNTEYFVLPEEKTMTMKEFLDNLENPQPNYVCYIQKQNSNLNDFPEIYNHIEKGYSWASKAFGTEPDSLNFWMGDQRAITSMHRDPYENLYCVIDGFKDFILISPTDLPYVPYKEFPVAQYENVTLSGYKLTPKLENDEKTFIKWVAVDPLDTESVNKYPQFRKARKYQVHLEKGDMLYLPSLWFHHVTQSHGCIAVNFWYDMEFDVKYCYYKFLEKLCE
ncbi:bifunctional peptidase and (3S)-lysyl hydroxylase Jmjd7 [Coccinella septempunctata]|uniref:bifunctional peptidase and (3S)-lysyl hydroxylase Jmjd7 n=1 Tax=Coccinella septempunctata TaxID=41139 RepID=UPI001D089DA3|nr:bifunctional peptidase and (3S)-lysyl hydroxylase Jmjd7 [Coccinella septempunctata]